jgi:hypothetical protein
LAGLLIGSAMMSAILCLLLGFMTVWMCRRERIPTQGIAPLVLDIFLVAVTAAAVALFYSVFLHPLLATAATSVTLTLPYLFGAAHGTANHAMFPVVGLANLVQRFDFQPLRNPEAPAVAAVVWTALFWVAGSAIFSRRDVTISPE